MEENLMERPAIARERRVLAARRPLAAAPLPEPRIGPEETDPHAACRAREEALAAQVRREMIHELAADAESQRTRAREEGFAEGWREGMERALEETQATEAARLREVAALVEKVARVHEESLEATRDGALAIGFAAACRILGDALVTTEGVRSAVEQVLARAHASERVTVRLAPADCALIDVEGSGARESRVDFVADASMERGGCFVESTSGTLDGRLRTQVEALYVALRAAQEGAGS